jgi:exodeoxyribonuclease VII small subunit
MASNASKKSLQTPPKNFEEALRELEEILSGIEGGEVGLEESLAKYERGNFLIQHCRTILAGAEKQIEILSKSADGGLQASPMEGESSDDDDEDAESESRA